MGKLLRGTTPRNTHARSPIPHINTLVDIAQVNEINADQKIDDDSTIGLRWAVISNKSEFGDVVNVRSGGTIIPHSC